MGFEDIKEKRCSKLLHTGGVVLRAPRRKRSLCCLRYQCDDGQRMNGSCRLIAGTTAPVSGENRADRIRTCDLFVPNEARYQPALQLDWLKAAGIIRESAVKGKCKMMRIDKKRRFCERMRCYFACVRTIFEDWERHKVMRPASGAEAKKAPAKQMRLCGGWGAKVAVRRRSQEPYLALRRASSAAAFSRFCLTFSLACLPRMEMSRSPSFSYRSRISSTQGWS